MSGGEVVREAREPAARRALEIASAIAGYPFAVWRHREILANFYGRELRARFRGTLLGFLWPFALPLVLFLVYYFVFASLLGAKLGTLSELPGLAPAEVEEVSKRWFTVYLFVGVICWSGFAESVLRSASVVHENSNLIKKISFPSEILPLNVVLNSLTIQALALGAFLAVAPFLGWNPISWRLLSLPALFAAQLVLSLGLAFFVAAANVFVRDTAQLLGIAMTFWQFLTPVFWSPLAVGDAIEPYRWALRWNPMQHLLLGYRKVLVNPGLPPYRAFDAEHGILTGEWPWRQCLLAGAAGAVLFVLGYAVFLLSKRKFADEL